MGITHYSQSAHIIYSIYDLSYVRGTIVVVVCGSQEVAEDGQEPDGSTAVMHKAVAVAALFYPAPGPLQQVLPFAEMRPEAELTEAEGRALQYAPFAGCLPMVAMLGGQRLLEASWGAVVC